MQFIHSAWQWSLEHPYVFRWIFIISIGLLVADMILENIQIYLRDRKKK